jgi:hypothetical protein
MKTHRWHRMVTGNERGATLVAVLALVTAVLIVGAALFTLGTGEADLVDYVPERACAEDPTQLSAERDT